MRRFITWRTEQRLLGAGPIGWAVLIVIYELHWATSGRAEK